MRGRAMIIAGAAAVTLGGCVQTRQYADTQFAVPAGDYKLLVMRPDVSVGSVTTGGLTEARADWTEAARTKLLAALRAQQAGRGGNVTILDRRDSLPAVSAETVAELERLHGAVGNSIALHKYLGEDLPTKRRKGLDWTLGAQAIALGRATQMDYALFLHAEDSFASTGRSRCKCLAPLDVWLDSARPTWAEGPNSPTPAWSTSRPVTSSGSTFSSRASATSGPMPARPKWSSGWSDE